MAIKAGNWLGENTTTTGTGSIQLSGAISGFARFNTPGDTQIYYTVQDGLMKETGIGTLVGNTLERTTIQATINKDGTYSTSPTPIPLSGNAQVFGIVNATFMETLYNNGIFIEGNYQTILTASQAAVDAASEAAESESNAEDSAIAAAASATGASNSAASAGQSSIAAASSASNAAVSSTNAENAKAAAQTSASNASTSETNAANSAATASALKDAAATSEFNASVSATAANSSKNAAATSETNAANSASAADASKTAAAASATNAKNSEIASAQSEANALQYKNDIGPVADAVAAIEGTATVPVGFAFWWNNRVHIPNGSIAGDGQVLPYATYPDVKTGRDNGTLAFVADLIWQSDPSKRIYFATVDADHFRAPDLNGAVSGSIAHPSLVGGINGQEGLFHGELPNLKEQFGGATPPPTSPVPNKLFKQSTTVGASLQVTGSSVWGANLLSFDANQISSVYKDTATDVLAARAVGVWCIQLFGRINNPGAVDGATLATRIEQVNTDLTNKINALIETGKWYNWNDPIILNLITWHSSMTSANTPPAGLRVRITKYCISIMGQFNGSFPSSPEMFRLKSAPFSGISAYSMPIQWFNVSASVALATGLINAVAAPDLTRCIIGTTGTQSAYNGKVEIILDY